MPEPIRNGHNFDIYHRKVTATDYAMKTMIPCRGFYELGFVISGDRKVIMPDHIHYLHPGVIGTSPMNVYIRTLPASNAIYESILVKYTPHMADDFIKIAGADALDKINYSYVHRFLPDVQDKIQNILFTMVDIYNNYDEYAEVLLKGYLNQLLVIILKERLNDTPEDFYKYECTNETIMNAIYFMESQYLTPPSIRQTARQVNVTPEHLSRLFKKTLNTTYTDYQNEIRLRHACELLRTTDYTMTQIANMSGFSNSNYMCDVFKKIKHLSPLQYRKSTDN